jgi:CHAT domain-containing protein
MGEFYRRLQEGAALDVALQQAQNYLRGLSKGEIAVALADLKDAVNELAQAERSDAAANPGPALRHLLPAQAPPPRNSYDSPFYWAPFVLVGAAE